MSASESQNGAKRRLGLIMAALIVLAFAAIIAAKAGSPATATAPAPALAPTVTGTHTPVPTGRPSESHADASAAYEKALADGKPIYILFHSLTCIPCIEISMVVDKVVPDYEDSVVFVNAISGDKGTQILNGKFPFQYIPQSFFIDATGKTVDSFTGAMDEVKMRGYLDRLAAK